MQGIELYEKGASDRLLMSGDHGRKEYDEVNVMKQFAIERNIPSEHIFMGHAGFSTYESLYRTRNIFEANKIIIVTQAYHLYRALYIAQKTREIREILARVKDFFKVIIEPKSTYLGETIPISGDGDLTND